TLSHKDSVPKPQGGISRGRFPAQYGLGAALTQRLGDACGERFHLAWLHTLLPDVPARRLLALGPRHVHAACRTHRHYGGGEWLVQGSLAGYAPRSEILAGWPH